MCISGKTLCLLPILQILYEIKNPWLKLFDVLESLRVIGTKCLLQPTTQFKVRESQVMTTEGLKTKHDVRHIISQVVFSRLRWIVRRMFLYIFVEEWRFIWMPYIITYSSPV